MWSGHGAGLRHLTPHLKEQLRIAPSVYLFGCQSVAVE